MPNKVLKFPTDKDGLIDLLDFMRDMVESGETRYISILAIDTDDCTRSASAGKATYIERVGLLHVAMLREDELAEFEAEDG